MKCRSEAPSGASPAFSVRLAAGAALDAHRSICEVVDEADQVAIGEFADSYWSDRTNAGNV